MKITAAKIEGFMKHPPDGVRLFLFYGPDQGLVFERSKAIALHFLDDPDDPFNKVVLQATDLKADPAKLADEAAALSFSGGRRVIRVQDCTDQVTALIKSYLENPIGEAILIFEAADLGPRSSLRKLFEGDKSLCAALPCYGDEGRSLSDVIQETLRSQGKSADRNAMGYLLAHLGADRQVSRGELDKLVLYMGEETQVTLDHVQACIGDNAAFSLDQVIEATASGLFKDLESKLMRCFDEGNAPIMILRALGRHFHKLHLIRAHMDQGQPVDQAVKKIKPPIMFKHVPAVKKQAQIWQNKTLHQALKIIQDAEKDCKVSVLPPDIICSRALLRIAQATRRR